MLGRRDREQRVGHGVAAGRAARGLGQAGRVGVDADHQRPRLRPRGGEDGTPVTRAEVDRDPRMARGELGESADVDFGQAAA